MEEKRKPGRPRKQKARREILSVSVDSEVAQWAQEYAASTGGTISAAFRPVIEDFIREQREKALRYGYSGGKIEVSDEAQRKE